jgi:mannose-1-phosphate guanylyltransferase
MALPPFGAIVLSAGFGSRLRPLSDEIPKPLVPVGGKSVLGLHLADLHAQGASQLWVNAHHHADEIVRYVRDLPFLVQVNFEETIRGTAGGIAGVREQILFALPLIVVNGDILGSLPLGPLLAQGYDGLTMAITPTLAGQGTVGVGSDGEVVRLRGQTFGEEHEGGNYMGIACVGSRCLAQLPVEGCLVGDWALPRLNDGEVIRTVVVDDVFEDIGTPKAYLEANLHWLDRQSESSMGVSEQAHLDPGVQVRRSVIGEGARVLGSGVVDSCVILPGAQVQTPLLRSIVTPSGIVIPVSPGEISVSLVEPTETIDSSVWSSSE